MEDCGGGGAVGALAAQALSRIASGIADIGRTAIRSSAEYEQLRISFTTFLGSAQKADIVLGKLTKFANETPYEPDQVNKSAKALLAFGFNAQELIPKLTQIGDISAATGKNFEELSIIYGKAKVAGTLYAEDINQLTEAGIPVIQEFAKQLGVSESQVKKLGSEGKISFSNLEQAFTDLTKEGSKFGGLMEAQSQSLTGQVSNLKGNFESLAREMGDEFAPALKEITQGVGDFLGSLDAGTILAYFAPLKDTLLPALGNLYDSIVKVVSTITGIDFSDGEEATSALNKAFLFLVDTLTVVANTLSWLADRFNDFLNFEPVRKFIDMFQTGFNELVKLMDRFTGATGKSAKASQEDALAKAAARKAMDDLNAVAAEGIQNALDSLEPKKKETKATIDDTKAKKDLANAIKSLNEAYDSLAKKASVAFAGSLDPAAQVEAMANIALLEIQELEEALIRQAGEVGRKITQEALNDIETLRVDVIKKKNEALAEIRQEALQAQLDAFEAQGKALNAAYVKVGEAREKDLNELLADLDHLKEVSLKQNELLVQKEEEKNRNILEIDLEYAQLRLSAIQNDPARKKEREILEYEIALYRQKLGLAGKAKSSSGTDDNPAYQSALALEGVTSIFGAVADAAEESADREIAAQQKVVDALREQVAEKEQILADEQDKAAKGYRNNVVEKQKELNELKAREAAALEQQKRIKKEALRAQLRADAITQTSNIITMATKSVAANAELPFGAGIAVAAGVIAGFIALIAGIKAKQGQINSLSDGGPVSQFLNGPTDKHGQRGYHVTDSEGVPFLKIGGDETIVNGVASVKYRAELAEMNAGRYPISRTFARQAEKHTRRRESSDSGIKQAFRETMEEYMNSDHKFWKNKVERVPVSDGYIEFKGQNRRKIKLKEQTF